MILNCLKELRKRAEEYFKLGGKWKNFGHSEREQRKMLTRGKKLEKDAERTHNEIVEDVLFSTRVIACTLSWG